MFNFYSNTFQSPLNCLVRFIVFRIILKCEQTREPYPPNKGGQEGKKKKKEEFWKEPSISNFRRLIRSLQRPL
jgi:hypothetical protein